MKKTLLRKIQKMGRSGRKQWCECLKKASDFWLYRNRHCW